MRAFWLSLCLLLGSLLPAAASAQAAAIPGLVEGQDYRLIEDGAPYRAQPGKVEVAEVFAYWCPHCAHFAPMLEKWKAGLPTNAQLVYVPAMFDPADAYARLFFAAEATGAVAATHERMFRAVHETGELPRAASIPQLTTFYSRLPGVDAKALAAALRDEPTLQGKAAHAREFQIRSGLEGVPSLIVNGRYLVLGNSYQQLLDNAGKLVKALAPPATRKPPQKSTPKPPAVRPAGQ